jgi:thioredoxin 1
MGTQQITDKDFEQQVLSATTPVVVDFWAEWCGPCRQLGPVIDQLSEEMKAKVKIVKLNIDENPDTPSRYGIRGIPTMMLFNNGELVGTKVGALPKPQIQSWIDSLIA